MHQIKAKYLFSVLLLAFATCTSQDIPPSHSQMVRIESDPEGAELYVQDSLVGTTPMNINRSHLRYLSAWYPSRSSWNASVSDLPDSALSDIQGVVALQFSEAMLIHTIPGDAGVYLREQLVGRTPLRMSDVLSADTLKIFKPGFRPVLIVPNTFFKDPETIVLERIGYYRNRSQIGEIRGILSLPPTHVLTASAIGLGTGIAAVFLKREADSHYTTYLQSGTLGDLEASERYDLYSGIALTILQLSLAYLIYELFITP